MRRLVLIALASLVTQNGAAQDAPKSVQDPQIAAAWQQISAQRVQADIEKLVSFGTRLTLSAQDPASIAAGRGIGAERELAALYPADEQISRLVQQLEQHEAR